jgi:hypothetical protein
MEAGGIKEEGGMAGGNIGSERNGGMRKYM